ncbi:MAG: flippase-like domain-containing protein [Mogibacterium sp.]|nr:flippase-like domain-containing protein [Mogibacterium sp.]
MKEISANKILRGIIVFTVYVIVVVVLIRYISENTEMTERILNAPRVYMIIGIVTMAASLFLSALLDVTCADTYGIKLQVKDAAVFSIVATAINLVIPFQMGSMLKAVYYKKKMELSYSRYISIMSGTVVIKLAVTFLFLTLSLLISTFKWNTGMKIVGIAFLLFLGSVAGVLMLVFLQEKILIILPFKKYTYPIMRGFFDILSDKKTMALCSLNNFAYMILGGIRLSSIFACLGLPAGIVNGMLYWSLCNVSSAVPILPGNIGISEAFVGLTNMLFNEDFNAGVSVVLVNRIYYYLVAIAGALILAVPAWIMYDRASRDKTEAQKT